MNRQRIAEAWDGGVTAVEALIREVETERDKARAEKEWQRATHDALAAALQAERDEWERRWRRAANEILALQAERDEYRTQVQQVRELRNKYLTMDIPGLSLPVDDATAGVVTDLNRIVGKPDAAEGLTD